MITTRNLTESLEKKYNLNERKEIEYEDELDAIMDDDSLTDEEREASIDDILARYDKENNDMQESLNESFVEEWWGQLDDDNNPRDLIEYGLKVTPLKRRNDETLYRFSGTLENINKARRDGYFYSLDVGEDEDHSEDLNESFKIIITYIQYI